MIINVQISWGKQATPIFGKGNKKRLIATRNHILLQHDEAVIC